MGLFNAVMALSGMIDTDVIEDERLARHTSYRIGGKADLFVTCHSYHALRRAVAVLDRERVPWVIIGKGSNLLVADGGYRGAVISLGREFQRTVVAEDACTLTVGAGDFRLKARGRILRFDGWTKVMPALRKGDEDRILPAVDKGDALTLVELTPAQHFTKPPARFSEASLVKELEKRGIGRPSTYASIISTIQDRGYVRV